MHPTVIIIIHFYVRFVMCVNVVRSFVYVSEYVPQVSGYITILLCIDASLHVLKATFNVV